MGAFGEKLRKQREQRGIELDAISNTTKISTRMLRALEDEHFDQLPGGVFNKGFVRAYARLVGLNEEEAIADYLEALRESQIQAQSILPDFRAPAGRPDTVAVREAPNSTIRRDVLPGNNGSDDHAKSRHRENTPRGSGNREQEQRKQIDRRQARRSEDRLRSELSSLPQTTNRSADPEHPRSMHAAGNPTPASDSPSAQVPWGKLAGALLLVALTLAVWNSRRRSETATPSHAAAASNQTPAPVSAQLSSATPASHLASSLTAGKTGPTHEALSSGTVSQPTPLTLSGNASPPSSETSVHTLASGTSSITNTLTEAAEDNPQPQVDHSAASSAATKAPANTFTVLIRAEKTTWVSIVADGKPFAQETLIAPANTSVRASREVVVKTGNAAGVSFLLNGKEIPAEGSEGEARTYVFDAHGVRAVPQTQAPVQIP